MLSSPDSIHVNAIKSAALSRIVAHHSKSIAMRTLQNSSLDANHGITIILSPAKTLDLTLLCDRVFAHQEINAHVVEKLSNEHCNSEACDKTKMEMIVKAMKKRSEAELKSFLKLSPGLAKASHEVSADFIHRYQGIFYMTSLFLFIVIFHKSIGRLLI